jgi:hypothetical protein
MEPVQDLMKRMKLSAAETKGITIGGGEQMRSGPAMPQAFGKVLAEKQVNADGLAQSLGRIWCPIKGIICKELEDNHFLFTFLQASGKKRALEEGPWMFKKNLVIVVDYDGEKTLEEIEFAFVPIWVRGMKMPFGMMHRGMGEAIGGEVGEFMAMDAEEDRTAMGKFLRIQVKLDIRKPLMRGVIVTVRKEERPMWCPLVYEFLLDFLLYLQYDWTC